ncbi:ATP-binding protein [Streptomyces sp. NPDC101166]|uniref:ATP-binding protein n=1 Tax=Streptomyces sp. NPDC101166 TaxID=3366120 RepID=UPI0037FC1AB7
MPDCEVTQPRLRCVLPFQAVPAEVRLLRRATAKQLSQWGAPVAADEAELVVTELATNVVRHVGEGVSATLILEVRGDRLRVEVHDKSRVAPSLRAADCDQECGRGLHLLASLAADWGTVLTAAGKAVWCEMPLNGRCRVERAAGALGYYQGSLRIPGPRGRDLEETAIELIADLLYWSAARGHDPDDFLDRVQTHYEAQTDAA